MPKNGIIVRARKETPSILFALGGVSMIMALGRVVTKFAEQVVERKQSQRDVVAAAITACYNIGDVRKANKYKHVLADIDQGTKATKTSTQRIPRTKRAVKSL